MFYYITKIGISAILIVIISEVAKRSSMLGALLASVPLVSVIAMIWLYTETKDVAKVSTFSNSVFWLVLPSLLLFIALPLLLKQGVNFYLSLGLSVGITVLAYGIMLAVLNYFGIKL